jgi:hypothetical protein
LRAHGGLQELFEADLGEVDNAIVDAVENPDRRPLCHRPDGMD